MVTWAAQAAPEEPTFTFSDAKTVDHPVWKATVQLGLNAATGNSEALGASLGASASRRAGRARFSGEVSGAYARSQIRVATESDGIPGIGPSEIETIGRTTTQAWDLRLRADRYFGEKNSVYATVAAGGDRPAGKELVEGGQVGYARALVLSPTHELSLELGYDLARQQLVAPSPAVTTHSGRIFAGYQLTPSPALAVRLSMDALGNLSPEWSATGEKRTLRHVRLLGRAETDVKVNAHGAIGLRFKARYDSAPAPLPALSQGPFEAGYAPLAERLDTTTELVFVYALR